MLMERRLNQAGGINVDVDMNDIAARMNLWELLRCWKVILAYEDPSRIIHAGPLTSVEWTPTSDDCP